MSDVHRFTSGFPEETGASTGDLRENDPQDAGFTAGEDRVFRSHFQRVNRLVDVDYAQVRRAYQLGYDAGSRDGAQSQSFEQIEKDLENGWLNVRVGGRQWASVRELARVGFDIAQQGRVPDAPPSGETPHDRPSYADPVADGIDPTSPESPEFAENGPQD